MIGAHSIAISRSTFANLHDCLGRVSYSTLKAAGKSGEGDAVCLQHFARPTFTIYVINPTFVRWHEHPTKVVGLRSDGEDVE